MFGWFKRKTKQAAIPQAAKSEAGIAREAPPPSYQEIKAAKRRRAKARHNRRK